MSRSCKPPVIARYLLLVLTAAGLAAGLAACSSAGDAPAEPAPVSVGVRKRRMLMEDGLDSIPSPMELVVTHEVLETYGAVDLELFAARVEQCRAVASGALEEVLSRYEAALWTVAEKAGQGEHGSQLDARSGYRQLDAKVESALAQLRRKAGVEYVEQLATFRQRDRIHAIRKIQDRVPDQGTLSLFLSPPVRVVAGVGLALAPKGLHEARAQAITFEPQGAGEDMEWEFLQARRTKLQKGGIVIQQSPWRFDRATDQGRVPLVSFPDSVGRWRGAWTTGARLACWWSPAGSGSSKGTR